MLTLLVVGFDCDPYSPRPNTFYDEIMPRTKIPPNIYKQQPVSKVFGAWEWHLNVEDIPDTDIEESLAVIKEYSEAMHATCRIRGALHYAEE